MKLFLLVVNILPQILGIYGTWLLYKYALVPHLPKFSGTQLGNGGDKIKESKDNIIYAQKTHLGFWLIAISVFIQVSNYIITYINNA